MITHDEMRKNANAIHEHYDRLMGDIFNSYITQQEKVTKLLELYRELAKSYKDDENVYDERIDEIEEDLKK